MPTRLIAPMKYSLATADGGLLELPQVADSPRLVADGLNTISAPLRPSARQPSGKWRS